MFSISRRGVLQMAVAGSGVLSLPGSTAAQESDFQLAQSSGYINEPSVYFDSIRPVASTSKPTLVLIHGGAHTGSCYLTTPDGRPGWAYAFARAGYPVIVPDWSGIGRSGYLPPDEITGETICAGLGKLIISVGEPVVIMVHSMSGPYGWKLVEEFGPHIAKVVAVAPGPPGNIQNVPELISETAERFEVRGAIDYVVDRTAPFAASSSFVASKLIGESEHFPHDFTDRYAAMLVAIPPRLLQQRLNIGGAQLKVGSTANYEGKSVLVVTGSEDTDHPREFDEITVNWLGEAGANVDFWYLPDKGINGNGHMMMLERNSDELADMVRTWIES